MGGNESMEVSAYKNSNYTYGLKQSEEIINQSERNDLSEKSQTTSSNIDEEKYEDHSLVYSRTDITNTETDQATLIQQILAGMSTAKELEAIPIDENLPHEIYAISISDGKVHVQGGEGYEDKASAYEKLLNGSLEYYFKWNWNGRVVEEETVLNKLSDMLTYYMDIDNQIWEKDHSDSIVNHVDEAFEQWYTENKPRNQHFIGRA